MLLFSVKPLVQWIIGICFGVTTIHTSLRTIMYITSRNVPKPVCISWLMSHTMTAGIILVSFLPMKKLMLIWLYYQDHIQVSYYSLFPSLRLYLLLDPLLLQQNHIVWSGSLGLVLLIVIIIATIVISYCYLQKNRWKWRDPGPGKLN